jgi:uracil-DNA glycosylase
LVSPGKGPMTDLDLENLRQLMTDALIAMEHETDVLFKSAAADTFRECLRQAHERGRHVLITNTPTGIRIEFLR